jgi:hypothetical protein
MTTFNWKINQLERSTADDYVLVVHYGVDAVDGEFSKGAYGTLSFDPETMPASVDFDSLTEEVVMGWVFSKVEQEVVEAQLEAVIADMKEPKVAVGMPWVERAAAQAVVDATPDEVIEAA